MLYNEPGKHTMKQVMQKRERHMKMEDSDKVNVLINLLVEKNNAAHRMRERSFNFIVWILGFAFVIMGFLMTSNTSLSMLQKSGLTILIVVLVAISIHFLVSIHRGLNTNYKVMIGMEKALKLYKKGFYGTGEQIYPEKYKESGDEVTKTRKDMWEKVKIVLKSHFPTLYIWVCVVAALLIIAVWIHPLSRVTAQAKGIVEKKITQTSNDKPERN